MIRHGEYLGGGREWWLRRRTASGRFYLLPRVYKIADTYADVWTVRWLGVVGYWRRPPRWRCGERV